MLHQNDSKNFLHFDPDIYIYRSGGHFAKQISVIMGFLVQGQDLRLSVEKSAKAFFVIFYTLVLNYGIRKKLKERISERIRMEELGVGREILGIGRL